MASLEAAAEPAAAGAGPANLRGDPEPPSDVDGAADARAAGDTNTAARWQKQAKKSAVQANLVETYGKYVYSSAWDDINAMGRAFDRLGRWLLPLLLVPPALVALWILIPLDTGLQAVPTIRNPWLYMGAVEPLYWPWRIVPFFLIVAWFFRVGLKHLLLADSVLVAAVLLGYEPLAWARHWIERDYARPVLMCTLFAASFVFLVLLFYFRFVRYRDSNFSLPAALLKKALLLCLWGLSIILYWGAAFAFARYLYPRLVPANYFTQVEAGKPIPPAVLQAAGEGRVSTVSDDAQFVAANSLVPGWYLVHAGHENSIAVLVALLSFRLLFGPILGNVTRQVAKLVAPQAENWLFSECFFVNEFAIATLEGFYYASLFTSVKTWSSLLPAFASILAAQAFVSLNASKSFFRLKRLAAWGLRTGWGRWGCLGADPARRPPAPDFGHAIAKTGRRLSLHQPDPEKGPHPAPSAGPAVVARVPFLSPEEPRSEEGGGAPGPASAERSTSTDADGPASASEDASAGEGPAAPRGHEPIFGTEERRRILGLAAEPEGQGPRGLTAQQAEDLCRESDEYVMWLEEFSMVFAIRAVLDPLTQALFLLFLFLLRDVEKHNIVFYPKFVPLADSNFAMLVEFSAASLGFRLASSVVVWFAILRMKRINILNKGLSLLRGNGVLFLVLFFAFFVLLQDVWFSFAELVFDVSPTDGVTPARVPPPKVLLPWQNTRPPPPGYGPKPALVPKPTPRPAFF